MIFEKEKLLHEVELRNALSGTGDESRVRFALSSSTETELDARPKSESGRIFTRFRNSLSQTDEAVSFNKTENRFVFPSRSIPF